MALQFFVNNKNVDACVFIQNEEIMLINKTDIEEKGVLNPTKLKCPTLVSQSNSEIQNGDKKSNNSESKQIQISSAAVSSCGSLLVACDSNNSLHLWKRQENVWKILSTRNAVRKCQKVIFTNSCSDIIHADRGGDVFVFSVNNSTKEGKFILGHISFITDISISSDDKFLVSCDRDGKIRVSCYPNCYNIQSYCLGHIEFVSAVLFMELSQGVLISGSGDGTLRLWDYKEGREKYCEIMCENNILCKLRSPVHDEVNVDDSLIKGSSSKEEATRFAVQRIKVCKEHNLLAILYHFINGITIYKVLDNKLQFIQFLDLPSAVVDALFFADGNLLVLLKQVPNSLFSFTYSAKTSTFVQSEVISDIAVEIQNFYGDFQTVLECPIDEPMLFKKLFEPVDEDECKKKKNKAS